MKLTIDRISLLRPLGQVQSVVERRNTIPILANVVLQAADGALLMTATDMDMDIATGMQISLFPLPLPPSFRIRNLGPLASTTVLFIDMFLASYPER